MTRVCVLTGASGLLGGALIRRLADRFAIVAVHHSRPVDFATQDQYFVDPLDPDADVPANRHAVLAVEADLTRADEIARVVRAALTEHGRVDLLVNAAGRRDWGPLPTAVPSPAHQALFTLNTLTPLWLCAEVTRQFWAADPDANVHSGRNVVNIASSAGLYVYPDLGQGLYAASKAALIQLSYHLASELWDVGVRVNTVAPDTFPGRVPTGDVLDAVEAFDAGDQTGQLAELIGRDR